MHFHFLSEIRTISSESSALEAAFPIHSQDGRVETDDNLVENATRSLGAGTTCLRVHTRDVSRMWRFIRWLVGSYPLRCLKWWPTRSDRRVAVHRWTI